MAYGDFEALAEHHPQIFAYRRAWKGEELLVVSNFYGRDASWDSGLELSGFEKILGNYGGGTWEEGSFVLRPYESLVLYRKNHS